MIQTLEKGNGAVTLDVVYERLIDGEEEGAGLLGLVSHAAVLTRLQQAAHTRTHSSESQYDTNFLFEYFTLGWDDFKIIAMLYGHKNTEFYSKSFFPAFVDFYLSCTINFNSHVLLKKLYVKKNNFHIGTYIQ